MTAWDFLSEAIKNPVVFVLLACILVAIVALILVIAKWLGLKNKWFSFNNEHWERRERNVPEKNLGRRITDTKTHTVDTLADDMAIMAEKQKEMAENILMMVKEHKNMSRDISIFTEAINLLRLDILKISFYTNKPISVSLRDGLIYVKNGGNYATKNDVIKRAEEYPDIYDMIIRDDSRLVLKELEGRK